MRPPVYQLRPTRIYIVGCLPHLFYLDMSRINYGFFQIFSIWKDLINAIAGAIILASNKNRHFVSDVFAGLVF